MVDEGLETLRGGRREDNGSSVTEEGLEVATLTTGDKSLLLSEETVEASLSPGEICLS